MERAGSARQDPNILYSLRSEVGSYRLTSFLYELVDPAADRHWRVKYKGECWIGFPSQRAVDVVRVSCLIKVVVSNWMRGRKGGFQCRDPHRFTYDEDAVTNECVGLGMNGQKEDRVSSTNARSLAASAEPRWATPGMTVAP
jgi:hypothetical protein